MNGEKDMDNLARKLLFDEAVMPPDALWGKMEAQLPAAGKRVVPFFLAKTVWLGLVCAAVGLGGWWLWDEISPVAQPAKKYEARVGQVPSKLPSAANLATSTATTTATNDWPLIENLKNDQLDHAVTTAERNSADVLEMALISNSLSDARGSTWAEYPDRAKESAGTLPVRYLPNQGVAEAGLDDRAPVQLGAAKGAGFAFSDQVSFDYMKPRFPFGHVFEPEMKIRAPEIDYGPRPAVGWFVGVYGDVRSTSIRISNVNDASSQLADSLQRIENASANAGFGIYFGYQLTPKWRISSGMAFANWCRTTRYPVVFSVTQAYEGSLATAGQSIPLEQNVLSATGNQLVNLDVPAMEFTNFAGQIPVGASLARQLEIEECFRLLRIPVMVGYRHSKGRFGLVPEAGLAFEHVLRRTTALVGSASDTFYGDVQSAENGRSHFLSFLASLHLEYQISEHIVLRTGANYHSWITPVYQSDMIRSYPRLWSVDAGLLYMFHR